MRIAVLAPESVPYIRGGAERLYDGLVGALNERTEFSAELVTLPSLEHSLPDLLASYAAFERLDVSRFDRVISTKYPSWMPQHDDSYAYVLHCLRGLYDTYNGSATAGLDMAVPKLQTLLVQLRHSRSLTAESVAASVRDLISELGADHPLFAFPGPLARACVHALDRRAFGRATRLSAISATVAKRDYFPIGRPVAVAVPPSSLRVAPGGTYSGLFTTSRLDSAKRIDLLINAARLTPDIPLRIAGTGPAESHLRQLADGLDNVVFVGHLTDEQLIHEYQQCAAVPFVPYDEDLGLVTFEAFGSARPVITCSDSGGPTEFVEHHVTGHVCDPTPADLANSFRILSRPSTAERMGMAGLQRVRTITWDGVIDGVLGESPMARHRQASTQVTFQISRGEATPKVVALSTYPISPMQGGGQIRSHRLFSVLAETMPVHLLAIGDRTQGGTSLLAPGFKETVIPWSPEHEQWVAECDHLAGFPTSDMAAIAGVFKSQRYMDAFGEAARSADVIVVSHPFLAPLTEITKKPLIYDSHNAEFLMKRELLRNHPAAQLLVDATQRVEASLVRRATGITVCSESDKRDLQSLTSTMAEWEIVPNGVDTHAIRYTSPDERLAKGRQWLSNYNAAAGSNFLHTALYVSSYHPPNNRAAREVVRLAPTMPQTLFLLVGSHCLIFDGEPLPPNVIAAGFISSAELDTLLQMVETYVMPMTHGGGTNLKLAEAFAAGIPVITTTFGARGYPVRNDEHLIICDIAEFPESIRRLQNEQSLRARFAERSRATVHALDWHKIATTYSNFVVRIAQ